ncbi:hypothetical protein HME9302_01934 [Alteripontixanthobacter maritimus]|uniref:GDT1 family protein n=1 Tax=Alteripontixanthobacter maritimus TaxID=2161824 RepID=A0A369QCS9_9SPHN|nr:hypothetical protein [Alteripontixanthobacter maritimus]RDC60719.1 hypothetical protein HME9302_01934 [Alteripontixanthobacter maritimus]
MASLLFAFVAVLLFSTGARDQIIVARLSETLGSKARPAVPLLLIACIVSAGTAAIMTAAGASIAAILPSAAKTMLVALALLLAAGELLWPNRMATPEEPTRSVAAIGAVLFLRQLTDAARFAIFALAAATGVPWLAGFGGALGAMLALTAAWWMAGEWEALLPLRLIRVALGVVTGVLAIVIGLSARGLIGA